MFKVLSTCKGGGYVYCRTDPPHPKRNKMGLYPLHRVLMENKLGRLLEKGEIVHHKNEDKTNDSIENLELKINSEHTRMHMLERAPPKVSLQCYQCSCEFLVRPCEARMRKKRS